VAAIILPILTKDKPIFVASAFAEASDFAFASSFAEATEDKPPDKSADKRRSGPLCTARSLSRRLINSGLKKQKALHHTVQGFNIKNS
jgi:hypothetical protein